METKGRQEHKRPKTEPSDRGSFGRDEEFREETLLEGRDVARPKEKNQGPEAESTTYLSPDPLKSNEDEEDQQQEAPRADSPSSRRHFRSEGSMLSE